MKKGTMSHAYEVVSADSHINEPPDLWTKRLPAKFGDRAPRIEHFEQGDAYVMEGTGGPLPFGLTCAAGVPHEQRKQWIRFEEVRPGGYDPKARIGEQDVDGVQAEIMYPTPRVGNQLFWYTVDPEFHVACIRAYNDWLSEYCSYDPTRLIGVALLPNVGAAAAVEELHRIRALPGMKGVLLGRWPNGGETIAPEDDELFRAAEETKTPLSIHVAFATEAQGGNYPGKLTGSMRFFDMPIRASQLIDGGVFDRFPDLQFAMVETDSSWLPYLAEQMDDRFLRGNPATRAKIDHVPSYYFQHNLSSTFITDRYGIKNRHDIGVSQMMWSTDYPHSGSNWPETQKTLEEQFAGVPADEKLAILAGNAVRLYGLDAAA
jgi:predicted TIM-barrel fold metal-dependent hydrolase